MKFLQVLFYCVGVLALTSLAFSQPAEFTFVYCDWDCDSSVGRPLAYGGCWEGTEIPNGTWVYIKEADTDALIGSIPIDASPIVDCEYNGGYICVPFYLLCAPGTRIYLEVSYENVTYRTQDPITVPPGSSVCFLTEDDWTCEVHSAFTPPLIQELVTDYVLHQCYPNPFNPVTEISYDILENGWVKLDVFDVLGRKVASLVNTQQSTGRYTVNFNASHLATGVYLYQLQVNDFSTTKKMLFLK